MALKKCPYCFEEIQEEAILCKHCKTSLLDDEGNLVDKVPIVTKPDGKGQAESDGESEAGFDRKRRAESDAESNLKSAEISDGKTVKKSEATPETNPNTNSEEKVDSPKGKVSSSINTTPAPKRDRRILEFTLGLIGGIFGLFSGVFALFFGGLDAIFNGTGTSIIGNLGVSAILFSILGIVGASLVGKNGKLGGLFMTVAAVCGFISVFVFYIIPGILLLIPGMMGLIKRIQVNKQFKWFIWAPITAVIVALIFVISMSSSSSSEKVEPAESAGDEVDTYALGDEIQVENLTYKVLDIFTTDTVEDAFSVEEASGKFLVLDVEVTNNDKEARTIDTSLFKLQLADGTEFDPSSSASMTLNENTEFFLTEINPKLQTRGYVVFDVPEIDDEFFVELSGGMFSLTSKLVEISSTQVAEDGSSAVVDEETVAQTETDEPTEGIGEKEDTSKVEEPTEEKSSGSSQKEENGSDQVDGVASEETSTSSGNGEQVSDEESGASDTSNGNEVYYEEYTFDDGSYYRGELINGSFNGQGVYGWADGTVYEGNFVNDLMEGQGTMSWPDGTVYTGEFHNDMQNGYGVMVWPDGTTFEGIFQDGDTTDDGEWTYPE